MYICPWQAPEFPPARLISSRMTDASVRPSPEPPYSCGNERGEPACLRQRVDERFRIAPLLVDAAKIVGGVLRAEIPNRVADVLMRVGRSDHDDDYSTIYRLTQLTDATDAAVARECDNARCAIPPKPAP